MEARPLSDQRERPRQKVASHLARALARPLAARVPPHAWRALDRMRGQPWPYCVVAFHRIWDGNPRHGGDDELSYPARAFSALCRYWRDHFQILNLDCLLTRLAHGDPAPGPSVTLTFDDGYADNFEVAAPILDQLEFSATFFLPTGIIGRRVRFGWDAKLPAAPPLLSWDQVRQLHRAGFGIGSHTVTHARLSETRGAALDFELAASRRQLELELGEPVREFAYPFGGAADCDATAREAVRRAGYRCCFSCHGGLVAAHESPFHLRRFAVSPRYHPTPQAWSRAYTGLRWQSVPAASPHW
ncbi:MAG: polysaccharide deacetylase family protein [Terriglobales bacterium]